MCVAAKRGQLFVVANHRVQVPFSVRRQRGIVVCLCREVIDNEGPAGWNVDTQISSACRLRKRIELLKLFIAA